MDKTGETDELQGSELGTQEYWDSTYVNELQNFQDHGDVGEIWFGEDSTLRVIRWLTTCDKIKKEDKIIDLGCGNGVTLVELAREGFTNLTGVDYSLHAIELAKAVAEKEGVIIFYEQYNLLLPSGTKFEDGSFRVAHDKGTYDAISLGQEPREKRLTYLKNVRRLLTPGGLLLLTSCNWTQKELESHFQDGFKLIHAIPTPKFTFGGQSGNLVTSLIFEKF